MAVEGSRLAASLMAALVAVALAMSCAAVGNGSSKGRSSGGESEEEFEDRTFYMGTAGLQFSPVDMSPVFETAYIKDMIDFTSVHQEFFGIPWTEFGAGDPPPQGWVEKMNQLKAFADELGYPVLLSISPLGTPDRGYLAPLAREDGGELDLIDDWMPRCVDLSLDAAGETIKEAYRNYALWMADFFEPQFFNIAVEINLFHYYCGDEPFEAMVELVNETYEAVKSEHPDLPVFVSFQIDFLWDYEDEDCRPHFGSCLEENLKVVEPIERDMFGIATYPLAVKSHLGYIPDEHFAGVAELVSEPLAITETGYNSGSVVLESECGAGDCEVIVTSSQSQQREYMEFLLREARKLNMRFVVWWTLRDYMPERLEGECPCPYEDEPLWCLYLCLSDWEWRVLTYLFGHSGVMYNDGVPKEAQRVWMRWFELPLVEAE